MYTSALWYFKTGLLWNASAKNEGNISHGYLSVIYRPRPQVYTNCKNLKICPVDSPIYLAGTRHIPKRHGELKEHLLFNLRNMNWF